MNHKRLRHIALAATLLFTAAQPTRAEDKAAPSASPTINGVPPVLQKNFPTRRGAILMKWNPAGYWISAPGALLAGSDPDEASRDLTVIARSDQQIPPDFSFAHVGNGQVKCSRDPKPAPPTSAAPAKEAASAKGAGAGNINGVPVNMQKTFMTRRSNIRMKWDPRGFWFSDAGALPPGGDPAETCRDLTAVSRSNSQIPQTFRFIHTGNGKVECRSASPK